MIAHPRDLLKDHTRIEAFRMIIDSILGEDEISDQIRIEYALITAGLHRTSTSCLPIFRPKEDSAPFRDMADYIPRLLELSRKSPFQRIRAMALNSLPNLDAVGALYGAPATLPDVAVRAIYAAKLGERKLFAALIEELRALAATSRSAFFIMIPPLTVTYLVDERGPCIDVGPGGPDEAQRLAMTAQELFDSLRVPAELPLALQANRFKAIIGNLRERKPY